MALILGAFDGLRRLSAVVDQLATETGVPPGAIAADVLETTDRLWAAGALTIERDGALPQDSAPREGPPAPARPVEPEPAAISRVVSGGTWVYRSGALRVAATTLVVAAEDPDLGLRGSRGLLDDLGTDGDGDIDATPAHELLLMGHVADDAEAPTSADAGI